MAYLIDETYFNIEKSVPNIQEVDFGDLSNINQFIDAKARLLIFNALNYLLQKDLDSYLSSGLLPAVPELPIPDPVPAKWRKLCEGTEYTKNGKTVKWKGLYHTDGTTKQSLISGFVFSEWLKNSISQVNGVGEVSLVAKNAINVNSTQRYVDVWNEFLLQYQGNSNCTYPNYYYYNSVPVVDWGWANFSNNGEISLIEFLRDHSEDYPDANLFRYESKNQLGL